MAREIVAEWPPLAERSGSAMVAGAVDAGASQEARDSGYRHRGPPTVGVRMPNHPMALELIREAGVPIAAPSANRFMELSPTTAEHVRGAFGDAVGNARRVDGGPCQVGIESTVVSIENGELKLLRPGMISLARLESRARSTPPALIPLPACTRAITVRARACCWSDHPRELPDRCGAYVWRKKSGLTARSVRMPEKPGDYAARLYAVLHELDREGWPWIAVEAPPDTPAWAAIRDRLQRASER